MGEPPKKDYPPGWNDPPMLNYNSVNPPPKSRIANKRIAFPLETPCHGNQQKRLIPQMPHLPRTIDNACIESLYLKASENFNKSLATVTDQVITEQISAMLSSWQNGKFSVNIQNLLTDLSVNMVQGNMIVVNEIYLKLATTTDNTLFVKTYLPTLKLLINP